MRLAAAILAAGVAGGVLGEVVMVREVRVEGGGEVLLRERALVTGAVYFTAKPPSVAGKIFTHWSISANQAFEARDAWGRSYDEAPFKLYEATTLTANYMDAGVDSDGDGVADGHELYWYGHLGYDGDSDTDGDGRSLREEIAAGTNPLMAERGEAGPVAWVQSGEWLYNPRGYAPYVVRSEPEGALFPTRTEYVRPGTAVRSGAGDVRNTAFAYWKANGVRAADAWGRALDEVSATAGNGALEMVAVAETDAERKWMLYWYGRTDVGMDSDTDGDGRTLREEIAAGTNPLMAERSEAGPVAWVQSGEWLYAPGNVKKCVVRSEPEGALFPTRTDYLLPGTMTETAAGNPRTGNFAYWTVNGVEQRDAWGRALDAVKMAMPEEAVEIVAHTAANGDEKWQLYWYGRTDVGMESDTDGDGRTLREEIAAGTNPLMAERGEAGPVAWVQTGLVEMNLQVYEQVRGALVDGGYEEVFSGGEGEAGMDFGADATPLIADVDGDGRFDIVVAAKGATNVFINVGSEGNPEFVRRSGMDLGGVDFGAGDAGRLEGLRLDVAPEGATGCTFADADGDGFTDVLVSDREGRVWFYRNNGDGETVEGATFTLQHKVWGGTHAGFAEGLRIAAVDWDGDGDLDMLAGTADGRLMLLRDPKVGRPTNVQAFAGAGDVLLTWDPNGQSRVRGYRVYRAASIQYSAANSQSTTSSQQPAASSQSTASSQQPAANSQSTTSSQQPAASIQYDRIAEVGLPRYRDVPPGGGEWGYRVSSVSRFYRTGNSTAVESESPWTEAVRASVGAVKLEWRDATGRADANVQVMLAVGNSRGLGGEGWLRVGYDPGALAPVKAAKSGLTEGVEIEESVDAAKGEWTVRFAGGEMAAGSGTLVTWVFAPVQRGAREAVRTEVRLAGAELRGARGEALGVEGVGSAAGVRIEAAPFSNEGGVAPYSLGDVNGDGRVDEEDLRLLAKLKNGNGRKPTPEQVRAGDFNGNGKLDNADYQALRRALRAVGQ